LDSILYQIPAKHQIKNLTTLDTTHLTGCPIVTLK